MTICTRCHKLGAQLDRESGLHLHASCLREWWGEVEPNIPSWLQVQPVESFADADAAELRARGVLT